MAENIKPYLNQKKVTKTAFTRLKNKTTDELDNLDAAKLNVIRNRFSDIGEELKGIFSNIFGLCKDEDIEKYSNEREELFESLDEMLATIDRKTLKDNAKKNEVSNVPFCSNEIKLPTLSLPTFSGTIDEWLTFSDLFKAAVSENAKLSGAQKLQYLKGALKGEAQKIVQSLPITDDNFQIAWDLLSERYFHKREILSSLMKKFLNMPQLNNESHTQILNLVDAIKEYIRLLETLDLKIDKTADTILLYIVQFKLDPTTRGWWERSLKGDEIPKLDELLKFLSNHARSITHGNQGVKRNVNKKVTVLASGFQPQCVYCKGSHYLNKCESFLKLSVSKRVQFVKTNNICFNCLAPFHQRINCKSTVKCHKCKKSGHHSLLHYENYSDSKSDRDKVEKNSNDSSGLSAAAKVFQPAASVCTNVDANSISEVVKNSSITSCCSDFGSDAQVLLCTAMVRVNDSFGGVQLCRALLDPGSQASLITGDCLKRLGLQKKRANLLISCLGASDTRTNGVSQIEFAPHFPSNSFFATSVYVVDKIVGQLPHVSLDASWCEHFSDLKLADPSFYLSSPIDLLLGVNIALPMLKGHLLKTDENKPFAVRSELGWIIAGNVPTVKNTSTILINNIELVTDEIVNRFWEIDKVPSVSLLTPAEKACEEHFMNTHSRDESGRYVVRLPFHLPPSNLGDSRQSAYRRLKALEYSLTANPEKYNQYREFMEEYHKLGHMELVPEPEYAKEEAYYLPHHAVLRECSSTTKLRVVFDASSKSSTGYSLNDLLMVGPRVQKDLYPILLRFRTFIVAVCADVEKMFRQIKVHPDDTDWQRILWRNSPEEALKEYRLVTVTYGTSSAPFLSTRVMNQLAIDERDNYPLASYATLNHFYVDDLLSGAASKEEAIKLINELKIMMEKGGFNLRKWNSSNPEIFEEFPGDESSKDIESKDDVKVLGIKWIPKNDSFNFTVLPMQEKTEYSKREILSEIAHVFDPLGLLSPCVVFMKILLQELWKHKLAWDEPIPGSLSTRWISFRKELHLITQMKIPRCVLSSSYVSIELHSFCDASEKAYCAAVYVRCVLSNSDIRVSLLTSKTRVAPLKSQSLPRLELCAALLLADVLQIVLKDINLPIQKVVAWTDSTITLAWLASEPYRWQPFVANRVAKIHSTIPTVTWCHVPGTSNPADLGTRGLFPSQLMNNNMWITGPNWLNQPLIEVMEFKVPDPSALSDCFRKEERKLNTCVARLVVLPEFVLNISSFSKLIRVCAWILRFFNNSRPCMSKFSGCLTSSELHCAVICIVSLIQRAEFPSERKCLIEGKPLPRDSKLLPLNLFLDRDDVIRVGGRLSNHTLLSYDQKHPMLLPKNHDFTRKVIEYYHVTNLHAGPQLTLSLIRQKFWFTDGRSVVRQQLRKCLKCLKLNLKSSSQLMGNLPTSRIMQIRVFHTVGVDYAGPFFTKCAHKRSVSKFKSYICLFICTTTKAIHLELVSELSTTAFIAALRRFISRRGCPSKIISDNGTNFKGAANYLKELIQLCRDERVQNFCSMKGIQWSFIPPYTPHFGGLWESAIKSAKQMLTKVSSSALLNFEEMYTFLLQIEACLNSRPLTELSSDPSDLSALTPAHFLVGGPIHQFPEPLQETKAMCLGERWRLIQRLRQFFWDRWSKEYLHQLQPRSKWWKSKPSLKIGDLVLIYMNNTPPLQWTLGRVTELFPGTDQTVRVLTVKTKYGLITRSINKVYLLPF